MSETSLRQRVGERNAALPLARRPMLEEEAEYQAFSFGRVGPRPQLMLEIIKSDGYRVCIDYMDLKRIETMDPKRGFVLRLPCEKITIEGQNLELCYRYVRQHRLESMREALRAEAMAADALDAIVTGIRLG